MSQRFVRIEIEEWDGLRVRRLGTILDLWKLTQLYVNEGRSESYIVSDAYEELERDFSTALAEEVAR